MFSDIHSGILPGTGSAIHSGILSGIYSDIRSGIFGLCSHIPSGSFYILSGVYSDILCDVLFGILSGLRVGMCLDPGMFI
jgi:hypothetical protein